MSCDIASATQSAIDTYGRTATLKRTVPGTYDPEAGTEGDDVVTTYPCKAVQINPDKEKFADSYEIGDQMVDISASVISVVPDISTDVLLFGTDEWRIMEVDTNYVGDTQIKHRLHLKQ
jgi:hypothetical protein